MNEVSLCTTQQTTTKKKPKYAVKVDFPYVAKKIFGLEEGGKKNEKGKI